MKEGPVTLHSARYKLSHRRVRTVFKIVPLLIAARRASAAQAGIYLSQYPDQIMDPALQPEDILKTVPADGPAHKPVTIEDTGVRHSVLEDLALKVLYHGCPVKAVL